TGDDQQLAVSRHVVGQQRERLERNVFVLQQAREFEISLRVILALRLVFAVALQEISLERLRVGDPDDIGRKKLFAFERAAPGVPAGQDAGEVVIGEFLFAHYFEFGVAIKQDQILVAGRRKFVLRLNQFGVARRVQ